MEKRINIAELLQGCPKGMELDCVLFDDVVYDEIDDDEYCGCPIVIKTREGETWNLTSTGCWDDSPSAKCVIFPKGKTTWEGFQRPFKDGDIVALESSLGVQVFIFKEYIEGKNDCARCHVMLSNDGTIILSESNYFIKRLATEEEKEALFKAIKDNGYKWNPETKTLIRLIQPKFKVGDKVIHKNNRNVIFTITNIENDYYICRAKKVAFGFHDQDNYELVNEPKFKVGDRIKTSFNASKYDITELTDTHYTLVEVEHKFKYTEPINEDENWELVSNKFDISTLVPFDSRVLVRDSNNSEWEVSFWGRLTDNQYGFKYDTVRGCYKQCIPYEGNEYLLGNTASCNNYYKTWE